MDFTHQDMFLDMGESFVDEDDEEDLTLLTEPLY
jgi:hypothetical protein